MVKYTFVDFPITEQVARKLGAAQFEVNRYPDSSELKLDLEWFDHFENVMLEIIDSIPLVASCLRHELFAVDFVVLQLRRGQHVHALGARPNHVHVVLDRGVFKQLVCTLNVW